MSRLEWLNSLCPRLQHLLQIAYSKSFNYSLDLANQAVKQSVKMIHQGFNHYGAFPETIAGVTLSGDDERALRQIVFGWRNSPEHDFLLRFHREIGIGFSYDERNDFLYATARLY